MHTGNNINNNTTTNNNNIKNHYCRRIKNKPDWNN